MVTFSRMMIRDILCRAHEYQKDNWDTTRFGPDPVANRPGQILFNLEDSTDRFMDALGHCGDYEWIYNVLKDEGSRKILMDLLAYRVLGCGHVRLSLSTEQYWNDFRRNDAQFMVQPRAAMLNGFPLNLYSLEINDFKIKLITASVQGLLLGQYYYVRGGVCIQPDPGDVVIDGGGCWGDTAIAFACTVAPLGKVFTFEFVPASLKVLRTNLEVNENVSGLVTVVEKALAERSGMRISYSDHGPGTCLDPSGKSGFVETVSIDDFVNQENLERVDFVKMDIEGSELAALQGARQTIKKYRPKLAICVYHRPHDFFEVPRLVRQIEPSYQFYLDHYSIHLEETVLYARPT